MARRKKKKATRCRARGMRCEAKTKKGFRCKNYIARGKSKYCSIHGK